MNSRVALSFLIFGLLTSTTAFADLRATTIIKKGEQKIRGRSTQSLMTMTIKRPTYTRVLKVRAWTKGNDKALVEILSPKKEEGVASLRNDDQMWNYLPRIDRAVRVPPSMMLQSWMGSDFANDDLMQSSLLGRDYDHLIVKHEKINGEDTILIRCIPKKNAPVVWGGIHRWVRKKDNLPVQTKYFDQWGRWVRTITFSRFRKMDDRVVPTRLEVRVAKPKGQMTTVQYSRIVFDRRISESVFKKENLRKNSQNGKVITAGWMYMPLGRR